MSEIQLGLAVVLLLVLVVLLGAGLYLAGRIRRSVRSFSRQAFGTDSLTEGFQRMEEEYAAEPKSVSAMTSLYLPKIKKEFPEFQYDEMKVRAENVLTSYLLSISRGDPGLLSEGSRELRDKLRMQIEQLKGRGEKERFDEIRLHRTEISNYRKSSGRCIITFQTALQYRRSHIGGEREASPSRRGASREGTKEASEQSRLCQARYNTELVYIQDRNLVEDERDLSLGLNCPNCGAPLSGLGSKVCEYCGTPVVELNLYAWTFHNVTEES